MNFTQVIDFVRIAMKFTYPLKTGNEPVKQNANRDVKY